MTCRLRERVLLGGPTAGTRRCPTFNLQPAGARKFIPGELSKEKLQATT
jgi:hypothetical protein